MFWLGFCALNLEMTTSMHGMPFLPLKMPVPNYKSWELPTSFEVVGGKLWER